MGTPGGLLNIAPLRDATDPDWLALRQALWPDDDASEPVGARLAEHLAEMASQLAEPQRFAQFIARDAGGEALGLVEAALRHDYVPGTDSTPVGFLEGLYVVPAARRQGVARALVKAAADWARAQGCTELASDTPLDNLLSQAVHERLGFAEAERVVFFSKRL